MLIAGFVAVAGKHSIEVSHYALTRATDISALAHPASLLTLPTLLTRAADRAASKTHTRLVTCSMQRARPHPTPPPTHRAKNNGPPLRPLAKPLARPQPDPTHPRPSAESQGPAPPPISPQKRLSPRRGGPTSPQRVQRVQSMACRPVIRAVPTGKLLPGCWVRGPLISLQPALANADMAFVINEPGAADNSIA